MHDICNNNMRVPFFPLISKKTEHKNHTRKGHNVHVNNLLSLDRQNLFISVYIFGIIHR